MRDLVVCPQLWACPCWSQVWCGRENSSAVFVDGGNRCESTVVCVVVVPYQDYSHSHTRRKEAPPPAAMDEWDEVTDDEWGEVGSRSMHALS